MDDTITTVVEELMYLFKTRVEESGIGEAAISDGDYKDEAREIAECAIVRAKAN